jgi:hypothetical protein
MQAAACCPSDGASAFIGYLYLKYHPYCYTSNTNVQACKQPHAAHPTRPRHLGLVFPCSDKKATIIYTLTDVMSIPMPPTKESWMNKLLLLVVMCRPMREQPCQGRPCLLFPLPQFCCSVELVLSMGTQKWTQQLRLPGFHFQEPKIWFATKLCRNYPSGPRFGSSSSLLGSEHGLILLTGRSLLHPKGPKIEEGSGIRKVGTHNLIKDFIHDFN